AQTRSCASSASGAGQFDRLAGSRHSVASERCEKSADDCAVAMSPRSGSVSALNLRIPDFNLRTFGIPRRMLRSLPKGSHLILAITCVRVLLPGAFDPKESRRGNGAMGGASS